MVGIDYLESKKVAPQAKARVSTPTDFWFLKDFGEPSK